MALALYQKGLFAWSKWSAMLGEESKTENRLNQGGRHSPFYAER
jgi:hypothetical protein